MSMGRISKQNALESTDFELITFAKHHLSPVASIATVLLLLEKVYTDGRFPTTAVQDVDATQCTLLSIPARPLRVTMS